MANQPGLLPADSEQASNIDRRSDIRSSGNAGSEIVNRDTNGVGLRKEYTVVARRYRPQTFDELVGQEHVANSLKAAIRTNRVGHAFLFTGARGTGKTTTARILAKALNCEQGPTINPCNVCDTCRSISEGQDVDALEIDGASNRRIEEIRQLRQNVNIRPSRSRFKIYIIDEVHMLTNEAFNALLKTLEEPPEHVKFIFCTTEADRIPVTILSRCQRFDFANVDVDKIVDRLQHIAAVEGVEVEPAALRVLARRAGGSMRDSQSLLEQLLAFGNQKITVANVHAMLGTAGTTRMGQLVRHIADRNTGAALAELDAAVREGVDVGQLLGQLLAHFRDLMVTVAGAAPDALLHNQPSDHAELLSAGRRLGMETILAMMQIVDQTIARLRWSVHARTLAELALVRVCTLDRLESISSLIEQARSGLPANAARSATLGGTVSSEPTAAKKKLESANEPIGRDFNGVSRSEQDQFEPIAVSALENDFAATFGPGTCADGSESHAISREDPDQPSRDAQRNTQSPIGESIATDRSTLGNSLPSPTQVGIEQAWQTALANLDNLAAEQARQATDLAFRAPNQLVVTFAAQYNFGKQYCERPENAAQLEAAVAEVLGRNVRLVFAIAEGEATTAPRSEVRSPAISRQRVNERLQSAFVKRAGELFNARVVRVEEPETS